MAQKLTAGFPPDLTISSGYVVRFRAVDPTSGADVAGVTITNAAMYVDDLLADTPTGADAPMPFLVPTDA